MTLNRVKRADTFMKYFARIDFLTFLTFLPTTLIWNKSTFRLLVH